MVNDDVKDGSHTSTSERVQNEVSSIVVKLPPFWKSHPALWFCQVEAQFEAQRITKDRSKI